MVGYADCVFANIEDVAIGIPRIPRIAFFGEPPSLKVS
jgi:hypothetical protein